MIYLIGVQNKMFTKVRRAMHVPRENLNKEIQNTRKVPKEITELKNTTELKNSIKGSTTD